MESQTKELDKMNPIGVKITRAEKRDRKIIIVIESDLYSDETFAVNPFYDEGDQKNQLQEIHFDLKITERSGKVKANVQFGNCLSHFTRGHTQLHKPITNFFIDKKDCAIDWFSNEKREYYTEEKISKALAMWLNDLEFYNKLLDISENRKKQFLLDDLNEAKEKYHKALDELNMCIDKIYSK